MKDFVYQVGARPRNLPDVKEKLLLSKDHIQDEFGGPDGVPGAPRRRGAIVRTFAQLPRRAQACIDEGGHRFLKKNIPRP